MDNVVYGNYCLTCKRLHSQCICITHTNINIYCKKCGGILSGFIPSTGDKLCNCPVDIEVPTKTHLQGWECPRCHRIHSSYTTQCWCPPAIKTSATT